MRYFCHFCGKSVTSELPDDSVIRAILVCPECARDAVKDDYPNSVMGRRRTREWTRTIDPDK